MGGSGDKVSQGKHTTETGETKRELPPEPPVEQRPALAVGSRVKAFCISERYPELDAQVSGLDRIQEGAVTVRLLGQVWLAHGCLRELGLPTRARRSGEEGLQNGKGDTQKDNPNHPLQQLDIAFQSGDIGLGCHCVAESFGYGVNHGVGLGFGETGSLEFAGGLQGVESGGCHGSPFLQV